MLKAVFLDYNGTIVMNAGAELQELISRIIRGSRLNTADEFLPIWWDQIRSAEASSNQGPFVSEEQITRNCLQYFAANYGLQENLEELVSLVQKFWTLAPLYSDVIPFFTHCPWPIYVISNNGAEYISERMESAGLHPAGLISGEMVQCYKPKPELYLKALAISGCRPDDVIHIGDSLNSDYLSACSVGIPAILLDRNHQYKGSDYRCTESLTALLKELLCQNTYTVEEILEPDYGCEGIPEGEAPKCRVILTDANGFRHAVTELDSLLYKRKIDEGSRVILSAQEGLLPVNMTF